MKRLLLILLFVIVLAGLAAALWGNRLVASTLDARLPPLLTKQLGLPVTLAPMKARVLALRASSARLVMGDPADPAVVATEVEVGLSLPDLLTGKISLVYAGADDLMVKPARWPSSGKPPPDNYRFLDPWLPRRLQFNTGRFVMADGSAYPVQSVSWWRRLVGGVQIKWQEQRQGGTANLAAELDSLENLLDLTDLQLKLTGDIKQVAQSAFTVSVQIQPGARDPYFLQSTVEAFGSRLTTEASGSKTWALPDTSQSHFDTLDLGQLGDFLGLYERVTEEETPETFLASSLPALNLISHKGQLSIDNTTLTGETVRNTTLSFAADKHGLRIDPLQLDGPKAGVKGSVIIDSTDKGWDFSLDAKLLAHEGGSISPAFDNTHWRWETGSAQLKGRGSTWGELLYSLQGHIAASGQHTGEALTPISVNAQMDSHSGEFALDELEVALGDARFYGNATLTGTDQRKLTLALSGEKLGIDFLFGAEDVNNQPGIAVPLYLNALPGLDLDWSLQVSDLDAPGIQLANASARLLRDDAGGSLVANAVGLTGGTLDLKIDANTPEGSTGQYMLHTTFKRLDLPRMFEQPNLLHSRSSGTLHFEGNGDNMLDIFKNMQGNTSVEVELRPDNNWQRDALLNEKLTLAGNGSFVIEDTNIVGGKIENLDIDSSEQDLTGTLSMIVTRDPWLIADLQSEKLDIRGLRDLLPETSEEADETGILQTLRNLGAAKLSLAVDSLTIADAPVSRLELSMESSKERFEIKEAAFFADDSRLEGTGEITWEGAQTRIELSTRLVDADLDQFLVVDPEMKHVPVSGTIQLNSEGESIADLIGNLTGHVDLYSKKIQAETGEPSRQISMTARRITNGVAAEIASLRLGTHQLAGSVNYLRSSPPQIDVTIQGGSFSLRPWETGVVDENGKADKSGKEKAESGNAIGKAASASASAVGKVLTAPLRLLQAGEDRSQKRFFSDEPLPLDMLNKANITIKGQLGTLESSLMSVHELSFDGVVKDGNLDVHATAGNLNEGTATVDFTVNSDTQPPSMHFKSDFEDVRGLTSDNTYSRSGFMSFSASGNSTATLAASLDGLLYVELGPGPFDYQNAALLSAGLASQVFDTLIPGSTKKTPQLECGVTVARFEKGKGTTPYGYALRTNQANLLGHLKVDLGKEEMSLNFESRSRTGVGLSVGNIVSNSVQVRGSLTNPQIVPRATSLAWRGWAAFMTGGLSVLAESAIKRAMASENPCPPMEKLIRKEMCGSSELAASSPRMCPEAAPVATN